MTNPKEQAFKYLNSVSEDEPFYEYGGKINWRISKAIDVAIKHKTQQDVKVLERLREKQCDCENISNHFKKCHNCELIDKAINEMKKK